MATRTITVRRVLSDASVKALLGKAPTDNDYDTLLSGEDADVIDEDTGATVLKVRCGVLKKWQLFSDSWGNVADLEPPSTSRANAAGELDIEKLRKAFPSAVGFVPVSEKNHTTGYLVDADGKVRSGKVSNPVLSFLAGYGCRRFSMEATENRLTRHFPDRWANSIPFYQEVSKWHSHLVPDVHALQLARIAEFHPRWAIPDTCLSTVTINVNYESTYHFDVGDFKDGFSTISAVRFGEYDGGFLVFPHYRVALDLWPGDIAVKQSHLHIHGNTPLVPKTPDAKRVSTINYLKHKLANAPNRLDGPSVHHDWFHGKQPLRNNRDLLSSIKRSRKV